MKNQEVNQTVDQIKIDQLKDEIDILKDKIKELRINNNSFIYSALTKVQSEMPIIQKNTTRFGNQRYAQWSDIVKISIPIMTKYGLSFVQSFDTIDGHVHLITRLCHSSGQCIESKLRFITNKDEKTNLLHLYGGAITYLKRYAFCAMLGIATADEDTDGN